MVSYPEYSLDTTITDFFTQTSTTRKECDLKAKDLVGGDVIPVPQQGNCSYTVYAGRNLEFVIQFRLGSLMFKPEIEALAREIHGALVPNISFHGILGDGSKEFVLVYVMSRIRGISYLEFILANGYPENSEENKAWRKTFMRDVARFFATAWRAPQQIDSKHREHLHETYVKELRLLLQHLPPRFHPHIQKCLDSMDEIFSLPMVLTHKDFSTCNIMVDEKSCRLTGVIDWAEATIEPFGQNLEMLECFTGALHLKNGWRRFEDYEELQKVFWNTFQEEVGEISEKIIKTIRRSRTMGLLLANGFTSRLTNRLDPVPIADDETGRYKTLSLDGFLINPDTKLDDFLEEIL